MNCKSSENIFLEKKLTSWYLLNSRKLPWRKDKNPYNIWLSEIILQQTKVVQGIDYYHKFAETFPTIFDLAKADEQKVLNMWQGLGYYSRARNLLKTANIIANEFNGKFPESAKELSKLPGIGVYTSAAIASICFNEVVPAIDGNAYRVYSRVLGISKDISERNSVKYFKGIAMNYIKKHQSGTFNQAIMEFGALICTPKKPKCTICLAQSSCYAFRNNKQSDFPVKTKKVKVRNRFFQYFYIINKENEFLINKRVENDIWKNLYQLPLKVIENIDKEQGNFMGYKTELVLEGSHKLTHQKLKIQFYKVLLPEKVFRKIAEREDCLLVTFDDYQEYPFPKPIDDFLKTIQK